MPAEPELRGVSAGPSLIAGRGVRADGELAEGAVVLLYTARPAAVDELGPINHSCDPDLGWRDDTTLVARRPVAAGAEVTLDYATVIDDPDWVLWCHCETYRCRQVIEGTDWRIPQLQLRYAGVWAPTLQRRIDDSRGAELA